MTVNKLLRIYGGPGAVRAGKEEARLPIRIQVNDAAESGGYGPDGAAPSMKTHWTAKRKAHEERVAKSLPPYVFGAVCAGAGAISG